MTSSPSDPDSAAPLGLATHSFKKQVICLYSHDIERQRNNRKHESKGKLPLGNRENGKQTEITDTNTYQILLGRSRILGLSV